MHYSLWEYTPHLHYLQWQKCCRCSSSDAENPTLTEEMVSSTYWVDQDFSLVHWVQLSHRENTKQVEQCKQLQSMLSMSVWPAEILQTTCFLWVIHEQGLTAPVVSPVQIKLMIFALTGSSLQAYVNIFSYRATPHDWKAELTGFQKLSVKCCHTCLAWPVRGQQHIGWYWIPMRHGLL